MCVSLFFIFTDILPTIILHQLNKKALRDAVPQLANEYRKSMNFCKLAG